MDKRYKKIFVIILFVLLLLPLTHIFGIKEKTHIYGSETITHLTGIKDKSFKNHDFQTQFESWWNSNFAFRKFMLKLKNTLYDFANLRIIHAGYYENIIEGKDRYLFGKYIFQSVYKNCSDINEESFDKLNLFYKKAKKNGVKVYFVLAPSKALTYYDFLPERYKYFLGKNCHIYERFTEK